MSQFSNGVLLWQLYLQFKLKFSLKQKKILNDLKPLWSLPDDLKNNILIILSLKLVDEYF